MKRFYVLERGYYLKKDGNSVKLYRDGEPVGSIPMEQLEQLTIIGHSSISGGLLDELIRRRIETVLLTPDGRFRARLVVDEHKHVERRMSQYIALNNSEIKAKIASVIVRSKAMSMGHFLIKYAKRDSDPDLAKRGYQIKTIGQIAGSERDLGMLMGIEGRATSLYFDSFAKLIKADGFFFEGRNRRPPRDPVNVLLSFVYTLLTTEVLTSIQKVGLDPYLGALHVVEYGRPSLACDLVEEWRVFLGDRFVLTLINRGIIRPDDFVYHTDNRSIKGEGDEETVFRPVEMKPRVKRALVIAYEKWMDRRIVCPFYGESRSYRGLIQDQAYRLLNFFLGKSEDFEPFPWWMIY